ncbi:MAG: tRNA 2-selenouridine(34) synthase MnmH [Planctomycetes bacterium]|nr:tRNA 2-selenouridine(34) synthase MnmH [Planctomycetota bacterium]
MHEPRLEPSQAAVGVPAVEAGELLCERGALVIDLRSPAEFEEDHVPGAVNVPLFDDAQRAIVGTLYRKESPESAFAEGREIVAARITELCARIAQLAGESLPAADLAARVREATAGGIEQLESAVAPRTMSALPDRPVVLHCWRGGLRSRSVVWLLRTLGFERAVALRGGYRSWRAEVLRGIEGWQAPPAYVLRGLTGVGKTLVLRELERIRPGWTIDLEGHAGHRSSLLGGVGLEPVSQKRFESRLFERLRALSMNAAPVVVFEGESRKVGDVILPGPIWRALSGGVNLELVADTQRRIAVLKADYLAARGSTQELARILPAIESRMQRAAGDPALAELLGTGRVDELVALLLEHYYDPLYRHSQQGKKYAVRIDAAEPARAAREIASWIESRPPTEEQPSSRLG